MVRRVTPAQAASMIRQAQQKQRQAISSYNTAVRNYNSKAKQAVGNYNRQVNAYNSQVRAHRQRLRSEIARLNARPRASTRYVTYSASVQTLRGSFSRLETAAASGAWSNSRNFLDLSESETANSVAALNSLLAEPKEIVDADDPALRQTTLVNELSDIDPDLDARWSGALFSLSPRNPDAARHFCTSAREILAGILDKEAPDKAVEQANGRCLRTPKGDVSRRAKILYCLERSGEVNADLAEFVDTDVNSVIALFDDFNHGTHGNAGRFDLVQLSAIKTRVEGAIKFLHSVIR